MSEAKEMDRLYFEDNPRALSYERDPLPQEWENVDLPADALVSVYRLNNQSRVRALENAEGERLAPPVIDVDDHKSKNDFLRMMPRSTTSAKAKASA
jgi:hypothetical protein